MTTIRSGCLPEDTPKAHLINNACHLAIDALRVAHANLINRWPEFLELDGAFGKPRKRKPEAKSKNHMNVQENAITGELEKPMRSYLCSKQQGDSTKIPTLSVHIEANVPSKTRTGDSFKNADIRFQITWSDNPELDIVFEAKVLRELADINSAYLGNAGLERFCRKDDPYTVAPIGGLLAYIENVAHEKYRDNIRTSVEGHHTKLDTKDEIFGLSVSGKEFCSLHKCEKNHRNPIWMIHITMGFPSMQKEE